ncbi:hypothetical protein [Prevotella sp.]|uniref:hypothetical protein n=1 Tax=Prevotella sp. TaxID=59823 RepID=UPI003DA60323
MKIIGIKVHDGFDSVLKVLKKKTWYSFGEYQEPTEENSWKFEKSDNTEFYSNIYKSVVNKDFSSTFSISVSSIVGKNGSGKSSLLEIMFRIINNFAYKIIDVNDIDKQKDKNKSYSGRTLCHAGGFSASLFFETDGKLGIIKSDYEKISFRYIDAHNQKNIHIKVDENFSKYISKTKRNTILSYFFYTICTNYSIYSFNENDFCSSTLTNPDGDDGVDGKWISGILHKNDGYLSPIVVTPYRDESGNIDVENEQELAEQRLATMAVLFQSQGKDFMDSYKPAYIEYRFNEGMNKIFEKKFINLCQDRLPMDFKKYDNILSEFRNEWTEVLSHKPYSSNTYHSAIIECSIMYLTYKALKVCLNYPSFGEILGIRGLEQDEIEPSKDCWSKFHNSKQPSNSDLRYMCRVETSDECYKNVVSELLSDKEKTHITRKIRQVLSFVKRGVFKVTYAPKADPMYITGVRKITIKKLIESNLQFDNRHRNAKAIIAKYSTYDEAAQILPPAFIEWHVYFLKTGEEINPATDNGITLGKMSSGEKQFMESASYILYHIKNIESIRKDDNRMAYHHINIVLDEAELYFHPEYQRTLVYKMIEMLSWSHIDGTKIRSVNFLIVTHSPFVLSDVPINRVLYLEDGKANSNCERKEIFAANVNDILYSKFFLNNTMGEVARKNAEIIVKAYKDIKANKDIKTNEPKLSIVDKICNNKEYYQQFIELVADHYIMKTLKDMLDKILITNDDIGDRIARLKEKRDILDKEISGLENSQNNHNEKNNLSY